MQMGSFPNQMIHSMVPFTANCVLTTDRSIGYLIIEFMNDLLAHVVEHRTLIDCSD